MGSSRNRERSNVIVEKAVALSIFLSDSRE